MRHRHGIAAIIVFAMLIWVLTGCGIFGLGGDTAKPLTPKAQATLFMNTYKAELADLQSLSRLTNATPAQKKLFETKQSILSKMKPVLDLYVRVVDANGTPDPSLQYQLNDFVNQLVAAGGVQ